MSPSLRKLFELALCCSILCFFVVPISIAQDAIHHKPEDIKKIHEKAKSLNVSKDYVHSWIAFPEFSGELVSGGQLSITPIRGTIDVVYFVASWCLPCQEVIDRFKAMEAKFASKNVRFTYIFSHDIKKDAAGFIGAFGLKDGVISNHTILKVFHDPPLPTVYVSDRKGWLLARYERIAPSNIGELEEKIRLLTIF